MSDERTDYGFRWGPANIFRVFQHQERRVLAVQTDHRKLQISISPTGRSVRVWRDGKGADMTERIPGTLSADTFLAEYQELRSFGITHEAAATRLGVNARTLERRFERAGHRWREKVA